MPLSSAEVRTLRRQVIEDHNPVAFMQLYSGGHTLYTAPKTRAFGIEAEFFGMERETAVDVLRTAGINAMDDGYHHTPRRYWRVTEDGSVSNEGNELVSPILKFGGADLALTSSVVNLLRRHGGSVDRTCGLHIHHNAEGMRVHDIIELVCHYALFQPIINTLVSPSRVRDGSYAAQVHDPTAWERSILTAGHSFTTLRRNASRTFGRFHAVNIAALTDHGSIEFRQHQGTLNGEKIGAWTQLTKLFTRLGRSGLSYRTLLDEFGSEQAVRADFGLTGMLEYLGASHKLVQYYVMRAEALANRMPSMRDDEDIAHENTVRGDDEPEDGEPDSNGRGAWCHSCSDYHYDDNEGPEYDEDNDY